MMKKLLLKWYSEDGTEESGKLWLAADLYSSEYDKDIFSQDFPEEMIDLVIKALYGKHALHLLYWWVKYGFKWNKMYWYKNK